MPSRGPQCGFKSDSQGRSLQQERTWKAPSTQACCPDGDSSSWETLSWTGLGAHTPGQETQPHPFLCLLRPARVFPQLRGAQSTGSRADPLPLMLIHVPPLPPSDPHGGARPTSFLCAFWYQPGKGNLKIKPGPECVPLDWAPVLTDLLILAYLSPAIRLLTACYQPVGENVLQPD